MTLTRDDIATVEGLIAAKMDILSAFRDMPVNIREQLGAEIEPYLYSRQQALRKPENPYTPRFLVSGEDINADDNGVNRGHAGPTLPRSIDFDGATGYLASDDFSRLHIRVGGGGADCMFDYLVSPCWADEVAAGRGTEGQTFTSLTGCTFLVYSTITGAVTHFNAQTDPAVIYICGGTYSEAGVSLDGPDLRIIGAGAERTTFKPTSGTAFAGEGQDGVLEVQDMTIDLTTTGGLGITGILGSYYLLVRNVYFACGAGQGINPNPASGPIRVHNCTFGGSSTGVGIQATSNEGSINLEVTGCTFLSGLGAGVYLSNSADVLISGNIFQCITGVLPGTASGSECRTTVTGNYFDSCTTGIQGTGGLNGAQLVGIVGNGFKGCGTGITFPGSRDSDGITIVGNWFEDSNGTSIGISGHNTALHAIIVANAFRNFTSGNEIQNCGACEVAHNKTDSGATLPDTGTGHLASGLGITSFWPIVETPTALTISSGAVTVTANKYAYTIDTEASAASDDLDTISGMTANRLYLFKPVNDARSIVFKHETGNLHIAHANADLTADDIEDFVMVWYDGTTAMVMGGGGGGSGTTLSDGAGIDVTASDTINWLPAMAWAMGG